MHRVVLLLIDLCLIAASTVLALFVRENFELSPQRFAQLLPYLALTLLVATPVLLLAGLNRTLWRFSSLSDYVRIVFAVIATVLLAVGLGFVVNRMEGVARSLPFLQAIFMLMALVGTRVAMRLRHRSRSRGPRAAPAEFAGQETVLIVGVNVVTELFLRSIEDLAGGRVVVAGILGSGKRHRNRLLRLHPVLGPPEDIDRVLAKLEVHGTRIDRLVITVPFASLSPRAQKVLLEVERISDIKLDFFAERVVLNQPQRPGNGNRQTPQLPPQEERVVVPMVGFDLEALTSRPYFRWKRALDAVTAGLMIVLLLPLMVLVGLVAAADVGFPPIFWQYRPGLRNWKFRLLKFRTMRHAHDRWGGRIPDEARLSPIGRCLRRTRLDELPQLFNILVGHMSFVGPRPLLPMDQSPAFAARLAVRPGLTGLAQVKGGRVLTPSDKAALDIWYVKNASLWLDAKIFLATLRFLLLGERTDHDAIRLAWRELGEETFARPGETAGIVGVGPLPTTSGRRVYANGARMSATGAQ